MKMSINTISSSQKKATNNTAEEISRLLDYAATHSNAVLQLKSSCMVLHIYSNSSYIYNPKANIRARGHYFLSEHPNNSDQETLHQPTKNGKVYSKYIILHNGMSSSSEAEVGVIFVNTQTEIPIHTAIIEM